MTQTDGLRFALGAMWFGTSVDEAEAFSLLDQYVDAGGTMIDTANNYPFWIAGRTGDESESLLGRWLASRRSRDRVAIGTKVGARPRTPGDTTLDDVEGLSQPAIRAGIESSLRRLGTDWVDLYWAHIDDRSVPLEETVGAFDDVVRRGSARAVGASNFVTWRVERARAIAQSRQQTLFTALQLRDTYVRPRPGLPPASPVQRYVTDETLDYVHEHPDVRLWAYSTLLSGAYTRPDRPIPDEYQHSGTDARLAVLAKVAGEIGVTRSQVVYAWMMADGIIPIVGASTTAQLDEAIAASRLVLDADALSLLNTTW